MNHSRRTSRYRTLWQQLMPDNIDTPSEAQFILWCTFSNGSVEHAIARAAVKARQDKNKTLDDLCRYCTATMNHMRQGTGGPKHSVRQAA